MAYNEDKNVFILMPAVAANVSGQIGSVLAGGLLLCPFRVKKPSTLSPLICF